MIKMFLNFSYFSTNLDLFYLCLPLLTFVYLCSTDASMHKFCDCFPYINTLATKLAQHELALAQLSHSLFFHIYYDFLYLQVDQRCSLTSKEKRVEGENSSTQLLFLCYCSTCNIFLITVTLFVVIMIIVPSACILYRRLLFPRRGSEARDISEGEPMETIM